MPETLSNSKEQRTPPTENTLPLRGTAPEWTEELIQEEKDIIRRAVGLPVDFAIEAVTGNIWRTSQAMKNYLESKALFDFDLTFASFSTLFIVWIWGPMETREIARSQNVTKGTVSSNLDVLERRELLVRKTHEKDRRLVVVELTPAGRQLIERVFPAFNEEAKAITQDLTTEEQVQLASLLRTVMKRLKILLEK